MIKQKAMSYSHLQGSAPKNEFEGYTGFVDGS